MYNTLLGIDGRHEIGQNLILASKAFYKPLKGKQTQSDFIEDSLSVSNKLWGRGPSVKRWEDLMPGFEGAESPNFDTSFGNLMWYKG